VIKLIRMLDQGQNKSSC